MALSVNKRLAVVALLSALAASACSREADSPQAEVTPSDTHGIEVVSRTVDSSVGRALFVGKGCVICHSINGVGGKAGPALDASIGSPAIDPLEFAARMWRGAPAMIELQSVELGYTVYLTADEIANLAAFAADREEQKVLKMDDLPENIRGGLLDEQFWEVENWDDFLRGGQAGEGEPPVDE